jgi:predicted nuclease of predicted toxin-antitoxin system
MRFTRANCPAEMTRPMPKLTGFLWRKTEWYISKDADFYNSFTARKEPYKLLQVKTGNIKNSQLIELFDKNLKLIVKELSESTVVQISQHYIIKIQ